MALDILGEAWNISQKGEEIITENNTVKDKATLLKNALNSDFKETGAPILTKVQNKATISQVVLQIQKIRNISAPKANENSQAAPRMLKLVLTDGDTYIQAIETASIPSINLNKTPPGSKILINFAKICSGYLLLDSSNCSLLGGQVPALYEKWELAKSVQNQNHNRQSSSSDGPPAWVNFGRKIQSEIQDKSFKSLDNKNQENKESTKFDQQRQDAIAEATSGAIKKVFGGGVKQTVQSAPVRSKPNDFQNRDRKNKNKPVVKEVEDKPLKPSERVSLFDFLEDKLPPNEGNVTQVEAVKPTINYSNPRNTQNNQQYNKNRTYHKNSQHDQNNSYRNDQNSFYRNDSYRMKHEVKQQTHKFDDNSFKNDQNTFYGNDQNNFSRTKHDVKPQTTQKFHDKSFRNDQNTFYGNDQNNSYMTKYEVKPQATQKFDDNPYRNDQNNSFRMKHEVKPQTLKVDENVVNGLSNNFEKMSVNTQFASRSLRQHLNLGTQKKNNADNVSGIDWKVGDECMAVYWEDKKFYNAIVTAVTDKTCVVKFKGYGNIEEVLKNDCFPVTKEPSRKPHYNTAPVEFKRSARTFRRQ